MKGQVEKKVVYDKIIEMFDGAFSPDGKIIRVPIDCGDGTVEIKVTLTAAKDILGTEAGGPGEQAPAVSTVTSIEESAPTEEEKERIVDLLNRLGM